MAEILFHDPHHRGQNPTRIWRYVQGRDQSPPQCKFQSNFEIHQFLMNLLLTQLIGTVIAYFVILYQSRNEILEEKPGVE